MSRTRPRPLGIVLGTALALAATFAVAGLSRLPLPVQPEDESAIRLSWRLSGLNRTACVPVPPEVQEAFPVHMRQTETCESRFPAYRLRVNVGGAVMEERTVRGGGARGDRPLVVYQEIPVAPGRHHVEVVFEPLETPGDLPDFHFTGEVELPAGSVALLTLDPDARALAVRFGGGGRLHSTNPDRPLEHSRSRP